MVKVYLKTALIILPLLLLLELYGCRKYYRNKKIYEVHLGERIEIYYSTNSCCYYCIDTISKFKNIEFLENKIVEPDPKNCSGCNYIGAFIFKAKSIGNDTIKLKFKVQSAPDSESSAEIVGKYIVSVN
jgi:hypothetical protein